jgi:hypothetical protein
VPQPLVDDRHGEGARLDGSEDRAGGGSAARELRGDDRPRRVVVAAVEVEASQAGAGAGFHERTDPRSGVV